MIKAKLVGLFLSCVCVLQLLPSLCSADTLETLDLSETELQWLADHKVIRVSGPQAFPPFQVVNDNGEYEGLAVDYLNYIGKKLGLQIDYLPKTPWVKVLDLIRNGNLDLLTCAARSVDREDYLSFATPHITFPLVIISRKNGPFFGGIHDLNNRIIAMKKGISTETWLKQDKIEYIHYDASSPTEALRAVSLGNADAAIENLGAATSIIEREGFTNLKVAAPTNYDDYSLSIAIRKDWPIFLSIINKSLAAMTPEEHQKLRQGWIGVRYEYGISIMDVVKWVLVVVLVAGGVVTFFLCWNRKLTKEITERRLVESRLSESERKLATLISNLPGMAYSCLNRPDWPMTFISEGCYAITGYSADELQQSNGTQYGDLIHEEDRGRVWQGVQRSIADHQPFELEYRITNREGQVRWVWERGRAIPERSADEIIIEGFITDITEEKETRDKLQQSQKMEAIGTLAGGIAHDFNNILHAILGYAELASMEVEPGTATHLDIKEIKLSANRAAELVKQILAFSRRDHRELQPVQADIIVQDTLKMLHATLPKTVKIHEQLDTDSLPVMADPTGIQQIVINLFTNALHALEKQKGEIGVRLQTVYLTEDECIRLKITPPGNYTVLSVEDNGTGIDSSILQNIFEPYFTTKEAGAGTGLGLAAIHGIVKKYGGHIRVKSTLGLGSIFTVYLPVLATNKESDEEQTAKTLVDQCEHHQRSDKKILVVDDEPVICEVLSRQLTQLGYLVESQPGAREAWTVFSRAPEEYGLIITDQTMPDMTGADLAVKILALDKTMPIILCTGYSEIFNEEDALAIGIRQFIYKPVNKEQLQRVVQSTIR